MISFAGHLDMVRFLLEAGADQEHKTDEMHTALMEACMVSICPTVQPLPPPSLSTLTMKYRRALNIALNVHL